MEKKRRTNIPCTFMVEAQKIQPESQKRTTSNPAICRLQHLLQILQRFENQLALKLSPYGASKSRNSCIRTALLMSYAIYTLWCTCDRRTNLTIPRRRLKITSTHSALLRRGTSHSDQLSNDVRCNIESRLEGTDGRISESTYSIQTQPPYLSV